MSSLAATQADGYYVGTAYFDSGAYKQQSKNDWHNLQQSNRKGDAKHHKRKAELVVRFELPFSGKCEGCDAFIMRGTRYNATKLKTDQSYFSTPIYEFRMTCRACQKCQFIIRTDPQARSFAYTSGIERKKSLDEGGIHGPAEGQTSLCQRGPLPTQVARSSLERLEENELGRRMALTEMEELKLLQKASDNTYLNDADGNARLRTRFRKDRRTKQFQIQQGQAFGWSRDIKLLESTVEDECEAKTVMSTRTLKQQQWQKINRQSVFTCSKKRKINCGRCDLVTAEESRPDQILSVAFKHDRVKRKKAIDVIDMTEAGMSSSGDRPESKAKTKCLKLMQLHPTQTQQGAATSIGHLLEGYSSSDD